MDNSESYAAEPVPLYNFILIKKINGYGIKIHRMV